MVKPLSPNKFKPLLIGWDFGYKRPAISFVQLYDDTFFALRSMLGYKVPIAEFADEALRFQKEHFPDITQVYDYCDPAGVQINDQTGQSDIEVLNEILQKYGRSLSWTESKDLEIGHNLIRRFMRTQHRGISAFLVDPSNDNLVEGFAGGYHYHGAKEKVCGCSEIDGTKELEYYKHLQDCIRYIVLNTYADHGSVIRMKTSAVQTTPRVDKRFYGRQRTDRF